MSLNQKDWLSSKENVLGSAVIKKVMVTIF